MKRIGISFLMFMCMVAAKATGDWYKNFCNPSQTAQPWTFWYWMYGCVSDEGIRLDLNAMHDAGIAGFYLMPIKDVSDGKQYNGTARQLSPEWWKRLDTVFNVADSLNLKMG
ncbi:glycosyl hydrolase, partial [Xylanibacter caecicola]